MLLYGKEGVRAKVPPRVFSLMVEDIHDVLDKKKP